MKILAFSASNSRDSINKKLVTYATTLIDNAQIEIIDLNDYELPLFSVDQEKILGQPDKAKTLFSKIGDSEGVIISFAEHNGSYTAAYKNIFDWCSRIDQKVFQNKALLLLSTSPGPGGAKNVLASAVNSAPHFLGNVKASLSVPSFHQNFDDGQLINEELKAQLLRAIEHFMA